MAEKSGGKKDADLPKEKVENGKKSEERRESVNTDRRNSVLEGHGYKLGRSIGTGSYATVKV